MLIIDDVIDSRNMVIDACKAVGTPEAMDHATRIENACYYLPDVNSTGEIYDTNDDSAIAVNALRIEESAKNVNEEIAILTDEFLKKYTEYNHQMKRLAKTVA